jgi:hypothetical protein
MSACDIRGTLPLDCTSAIQATDTGGFETRPYMPDANQNLRRGDACVAQIRAAGKRKEGEGGKARRNDRFFCVSWRRLNTPVVAPVMCLFGGRRDSLFLNPFKRVTKVPCKFQLLQGGLFFLLFAARPPPPFTGDLQGLLWRHDLPLTPARIP